MKAKEILINVVNSFRKQQEPDTKTVDRAKRLQDAMKAESRKIQNSRQS